VDSRKRNRSNAQLREIGSLTHLKGILLSSFVVNFWQVATTYRCFASNKGYGIISCSAVYVYIHRMYIGSCLGICICRRLCIYVDKCMYHMSYTICIFIWVCTSQSYIRLRLRNRHDCDSESDTVKSLFVITVTKTSPHYKPRLFEDSPRSRRFPPSEGAKNHEAIA